MPDKIKVLDLPEFDMSEQLRTEEDIASYLNLVLEDGDMAELFRAIGYVAKAQGMSKIANETGLGRESLYKTFKAGAKPQFETVVKVMKALNLDLKTTVHGSPL